MSLCNCSHQFCENIPVSFDFITTWNQGVFLCSPCTVALIKYNIKCRRNFTFIYLLLLLLLYRTHIVTIPCLGVHKFHAYYWFKFSAKIKFQYPLYRTLGGLQGQSGRVRKISPSPRFDARTVQPVLNRSVSKLIPIIDQKIVYSFALVFQ